MSTRLQRLRTLDQQLVELAKDIKVLGPLSWPVQVQRQFLYDWQRGQPKLPEVTLPRLNYSPQRQQLAQIQTQLDPAHPLEAYLQDSAQSYSLICELMEGLDDPARVTSLSSQLYGRPGDRLAGTSLTNLDAARHFLTVSQAYFAETSATQADLLIDAQTLANAMRQRIPEVIDGHQIQIQLDPTLVAKAAAGATRVRLRDGAAFNSYDLEQLLQHEIFVHSLTALNGRCQPHIRTLGLGAPRTTGTQEGLATFAELVTGAMDTGRLRRIALRILALDMALSGADFLQVFEHLLAAGQQPVEAFNSAMRIYRGVPLSGGHAFTKDTVYLHGLMEVHTFFRWALHNNRLNLCHWLVAGRMTIADLFRLEPFFLDGTLALPRYQPPWLTRTNGLAAYLAFSVFTNEIQIQGLPATAFSD